MAIKFKEIDDILRKSPLTNEEVHIIDSVEQYIDSKLMQNNTNNEQIQDEVEVVKD